jgi:UTP--glucose-1-phosphate uridylyltransferase
VGRGAPDEALTVPITTAVVPVGGLGTRLLPATKSQPKEMLPVGGRPVVQHVVEELAAAGIERIVFVTGRGRRAIEEHFARDELLTATLERRGAVELLERLAFERMGISFAYVPQPEPRGLGDALLRAEGHTGDEPFAVALGDAILGTREPPAVVAIVEKPDPAAAPSTLDGGYRVRASIFELDPRHRAV